MRSSRNGCSTCGILKTIITGLYEVKDASTLAFSFNDAFFELWNIGGSRLGGIELHRAADTPCPWGLIWQEDHSPESTASQASLSWAKNQLRTCLAEHSGCGAATEDPLLPTRVLDVGASDSKTVKVLETNGLRGKYLTLSHCWGNPALMTTKFTVHNWGEYLEAIPCKTLPRTFRDAVTVTRNLNLRYLWIDSLCILQQDDEEDTLRDKQMCQEDWEYESERMCSVYQNSYLTLAGLSSIDCTGGLFSKRRTRVRVEGDSDKGPYCFDGCKEVEHSAVAFPLLRRGWVMQETLLSPRTLFYGQDELLWQCRWHMNCQCGVYEGDRSLSPGFHKLPLAEDAEIKFTRPKRISTWYDIISHYSRSSLTHATDKLVAIDGIAEYMRTLRNSEYLAGLWAESLAFDLLWQSYAVNDRIANRTISTDPIAKTQWSSDKWLFPTWSWASIEGEIDWKWTSDFMGDYTPEIVLIQHITDKTIPANELRLRGVLVPSTLGTVQKALNTKELYYPDLEDQETMFGINKTVECLRVVQSGKDYFSLVLVCVDEEKRKYERLGLLTLIDSGHPYWKCRQFPDKETEVEVPPRWWAASEDWEEEEVELTLV
ncbi:hypothetical protein NM208_g290 [Fusarium decemcellulare]|uniref:Uncharacterized protein n=1 Tax=Fusarium decemcellulare TaxID=57161 RepID=A0ACC1SZV6_9HYPO|nr:hypothetical protein NM208_g290 [Fusarium decemcellulare]